MNHRSHKARRKWADILYPGPHSPEFTSTLVKLDSLAEHPLPPADPRLRLAMNVIRALATVGAGVIVWYLNQLWG